MAVYELYKLQKGAINTKIKLTVNKILWEEAKGATGDVDAVKAHYIVYFKENLVKNFEEEDGNYVWVFPNPVESGSPDYAVAKKIVDADLFYYFISYLDKEIEFTINYKVKDDYGYYSVENNENVLRVASQEKFKWDQLGYTDKDELGKISHKLKGQVDKGLHKIDVTIINHFLVAAKKERAEVPDKLKENDYKVFREIYGRKLKRPVLMGTTPKAEDYYTGEEVFQIWKNGWNEETLPNSPIIQTGESTGKVKQPSDKEVDPLITKFQKKEGSADELIDNINNRWKEMITKDFSSTLLSELETRYKSQKDAILTDPFFVSYKTKSDTEKLEMLKSIFLMYDDREMKSCGNSIKDNAPQLQFIYWEYLFTFLKMIDEKSNQAEKDQSTFNELISEWNTDFLNDFGDKLTADSLKTVKAKLDKLTADLKAANDDKKQLENDKTDLTNQKATAETDLATKLKEKEEENQKLKEQVSQQIDQAAQTNQYLNKLLEVYKAQIKHNTEAFYLNDLNLDESDDIRSKYTVDYLTLLENLNGESEPQQVINAFKIVALICATDKSQVISDKWRNKSVFRDPQFKRNKFEQFNRIKKFWELNEGLEPIETNNPLYLPIIKDKETYKNRLDNIVKLWQPTRTRQLRAIDLSIFPIDKTVFGILQDQKGRKVRIQEFIEEIKTRFPSTNAKIDECVNKYSTTWNKLDDGSSSYDDYLSYLNYFNGENDLVKLVNQDALKEIDQLFKPNSNDSELIKLLKDIANDETQKDLMEASFDDLQGGVSWVLFVVNNFKNFYLSYLPNYVNDKIDLAKPVKLEELREKIEPILTALFADLHSKFVRVEVKNDLDELKKDVNDNLEKLKKLINESNEDLKLAKEKYKKERKDGQPWNLTGQEKARIDQATNMQDLEKLVGDITQERDDEEKIDKWIKEKISDKTKVEDLPSEATIDNSPELPLSAKDQVKWKLREKIVELMPENTTEEKIKKHLTEVLNKWRKWEYLFDNGKKDDEDYTLASMFNQTFRGTVAKEMEPEIEAAIKINTLEGYKKLDEKWGQGKINKEGEVEYNVDREYLEAWKILREFLKEIEVSKYEKVKEYLTTNYYGEERWKEIEVNAQIEVNNK